MSFKFNLVRSALQGMSCSLLLTSAFAADPDSTPELFTLDKRTI